MFSIYRFNQPILQVLSRHAQEVVPSTASPAGAAANGATASRATIPATASTQPTKSPVTRCCGGNTHCCSVTPASARSCRSNTSCCSIASQLPEDESTNCFCLSNASSQQNGSGDDYIRNSSHSCNNNSVDYQIWYDPEGRLCEGLALLFSQQLQAALNLDHQQPQQKMRNLSHQSSQRHDTTSLIVEGLFAAQMMNSSSRCGSVTAELGGHQRQHQVNTLARTTALAVKGATVSTQPLSGVTLEVLLDVCQGLTRSSETRRPPMRDVCVFLFVETVNGSLMPFSAAFASEVAGALADRRIMQHPLSGCAISLVCCDRTPPVTAAPAPPTSARGEAGRGFEKHQQAQAERGVTTSNATARGNSFSSRASRIIKKLAGNLVKLGSSSLLQKQQQLLCLTLGSNAALATTARKYCQWADSAVELVLQRQQQQTAAGPASQCSDTDTSSVSSAWMFSSSDDEEQLQLGYSGSCGALPSDVEDLVDSSLQPRTPSAAPASTAPARKATDAEISGSPEQLTPRLRKNLSKEGYKLVGTHSAVKLCRWTRSALRGRGGCYKHTFYGIKSFGCMEFTSSVACANRCLFCWRHHTNLAAGDWRWKADDPQDVLHEAMDKHLKAIKELRGLPGLRDDFYYEVKDQILHCALSLVGEPIMYPRINELLHQMHQRRISTFLVTNAQHPDALRALRPVTQLYLSIDAATESDLKRLDKPVHRDSWLRFLSCIDILKTKKQRTVFRLTLVHGYNCILGPVGDAGASEPANNRNAASNSGSSTSNTKYAKGVTSTLDKYASLVLRGEPDMIEIKGMTFCGGLDRESLSMQNVPRHQQVLAFADGLRRALPEGLYGLASEHEHSCCVLLANNKYFYKGQWHTWIDYPKFFDLALSGDLNFSGIDYSAATPSWAIFGAEGRGFDPQQKRVFGKGRRGKELELSQQT